MVWIQKPHHSSPESMYEKKIKDFGSTIYCAVQHSLAKTAKMPNSVLLLAGFRGGAQRAPIAAQTRSFSLLPLTWFRERLNSSIAPLEDLRVLQALNGGL